MSPFLKGGIQGDYAEPLNRLSINEEKPPCLPYPTHILLNESAKVISILYSVYL